MILMHHELADLQQQVLLDVAEQGVRTGLSHGEFCDLHAEWYPCELQNIQACFASLRCGEHLLGSVGTADAQHPLVVDAARNAFEVATLVAQRPQLAEQIVSQLQLELAVLSPLHFISESTFEGVVSQIQAGSEGVFVRCVECAATFLPTKWENFIDARQFLRQLCARAGIDSEAWPSSVQVATFTTQCFSRTIGKLHSKPLLH